MKYIYMIGIIWLIFMISGCNKFSDVIHGINPDSTSCATWQQIWYTWEAYDWLQNEENLMTANTGDIHIDNLSWSAKWLAITNNSWLYMSPLYPAIDWCNRESRYARLFETNISMLVMNCKLEDWYYTVNPSDSNNLTEDKYIWWERIPQTDVMKIFSRKNINDFADLAIDIPKWCTWSKVSENNQMQTREIVTTWIYTTESNSKISEDPWYLPCWEYWFTVIWRKRFTIFKSRPQIVFWSNIDNQYPLFDTNTIKFDVDTNT